MRVLLRVYARLITVAPMAVGLSGEDAIRLGAWIFWGPHCASVSTIWMLPYRCTSG
ncbi:hypothetical protein GCM10009863_46920 [Streptomyces axinellae]|uniref:Uncharacterized protein n=1 Tax=Streptomyces axinellae TaxID=552788 RepID=A0ABP6CRF4_9ACTN